MGIGYIGAVSCGCLAFSGREVVGVADAVAGTGSFISAGAPSGPDGTRSPMPACPAPARPGP